MKTDIHINEAKEAAEKLEERFGVHAFQIYTHKDEGANVWDGKSKLRAGKGLVPVRMLDGHIVHRHQEPHD